LACGCGGKLEAVKLDSQQRATALSEFLALSASEFEAETGRLLRALGWTDVRNVGGPGDLGADLLASDPDGRRVVVQCKRFAPGNKVDSKTVQLVIGMAVVHHAAEYGLIVTTSDFTAAAQQLAMEHPDVIRLWNGDILSGLASSLQDADGDSTRSAG